MCRTRTAEWSAAKIPRGDRGRVRFPLGQMHGQGHQDAGRVYQHRSRERLLRRDLMFVLVCLKPIARTRLLLLAIIRLRLLVICLWLGLLIRLLGLRLVVLLLLGLLHPSLRLRSGSSCLSRRLLHLLLRHRGLLLHCLLRWIGVLLLRLGRIIGYVGLLVGLRVRLLWHCLEIWGLVWILGRQALICPAIIGIKVINRITCPPRSKVADHIVPNGVAHGRSAEEIIYEAVSLSW